MRIELVISAIMAAATHGALFYVQPAKTTVTQKAAVEEKVEELVLKPLPPEPPENDPDAQRDDTTQVLDNIRPMPVVPDRLMAIDNPDMIPMQFVPYVEPPKNADGTPISVIGKGDFTKTVTQVEGRTIIGFDSLDNKPRTRLQTAPIYPHMLKVQGITGQVVVNFVVDENGNVISARIVSSTHTEFEEPALRAVGKWRFEPGRKNGKRVSFQMSVPIVFSLNDTD